MTNILLIVLGLAGAAASAPVLPSGSDRLIRSKQLFEAGNFSEVIAGLSPEAMQKLRKDDLRQAYFLLGVSYERSQQGDKALGVYQLGAKLFPKDINLLSQLAYLLHRSGLEEHAAPVYRKVLDIHRNNAAAHLGLGQIDHSLGYLERSTQHYEKALEEWKGNAGVWRDYADVLLEMKDYKTAELAVNKALDLSRNNPESLVQLAFVQRGSGRLSEALKTLEAAIQHHPRRKDISLLRALWLLEADRFQEAGTSAQEALNADPNNALARWIRARVHLQAGRGREARRDLEAAAAGKPQALFVSRLSAAMASWLKERP
ncbi:MAG: hypothetical protein A3J74_06585 [Elusimicrobia bacterium RIFCSPHIGHO2_02_FULL_57_9]|nr:MAG: hypothetical protein A3J74_06585 [Elusimicrobia bacterium RIFCSPHIGHO2_02_FULL_57_9]